MTDTINPESFDFHLPKDRDPKDVRVVCAMSGGVDSSVTAALLKQQGYDVVGMTMQLYDHGATACGPGSCCAGTDIHDARRVAEKIGIPHYVLDFESLFKESVMDDFADTYLKGETPIPCIKCNETVKYRDLLGRARDLGAEALVTGHYARWRPGKNGAELYRGADHNRDQSYFLFATTQDQLDFVRFPLGDLDKDQTRALAHKFDLPVARKPDSQDICFVPDGDYASVVEKLRPGALDDGDIVDLDGNVLGRHKGIINYTIGQRRGMGIAAPHPLYVVRIDADNNRIVVGPKEALLIPGLIARDINWLDGDALSDGTKAFVKVRSTTDPVAATLSANDDGTVAVKFDDSQGGVAPGQAAVFYGADERLLGGGWIANREWF